MDATIPIYVEISKGYGGADRYRCEPLFFDCEAGQDEQLSLALGQLSKHLRRILDRLSREPRHEPLMHCTFNPELSEHRLRLLIDLKSKPQRAKFYCVSFQGLGRTLAFCPRMPELWFEVEDPAKIESRAAEVYTDHFRKLEREGESAGGIIDYISQGANAWITTIDLPLPTKQPSMKEQGSMASLFGGGPMDGDTELLRVGRCLDWLYPDALQRAILRDREADELDQLLAEPGNRPVLVVGKRKVGKTALLHEVVFRRVRRRGNPHSNRQNIWLLSPQRLISGMSFVGQWEDRLLAILKTAAKRGHTLYFDDIIGLYRAGQSSSSNLSVADVIRTYVQKRQVRMLGELSPEQFNAFAERDRGFADEFQVVRLKETNEQQTLRIAVAVQRELEGQTQSNFSLDCLPVVLEIQRRYAGDTAAPGNVVAFLRRLANKYKRNHLPPQIAYQEFHAQTGLSLQLLDDNRKLTRTEILQALRQRIVGQDAALQAAADVVSIAKSRLNDPQRPLASLLFLGPTGVGKTQCAKALAEYLFGRPERVLRFDMNEFVSAAAVRRLVGTFSEPEGLLTGAVRREPFSVVLFDEIEKADPDVFDLLLQVTGEARLTDALGRTTDFSNTILILTSNLGSREASKSLGFGSSDDNRARTYVRAAEGFFRPEFFNRLDRVVPFDRLSHEAVSRVADHLMQDVFSREGLVRRRCVLEVDPGALQKVVAEGYHPEMGARAMKRAVERCLTRPVAARLAERPPGLPAVVSLYASAEGIAVGLQELTNAPRLSQTALESGGDSAARERQRQQLKALVHEVRRIEQDAESRKPAGELTADTISPEHEYYFQVKEQAYRAHEAAGVLLEALAGGSDEPGLPAIRTATPHRRTRVGKLRDDDEPARQLIQSADRMQEFIHELASGSVTDNETSEQLLAVRRELALLQALTAAQDKPQRSALLFRALQPPNSGEEPLMVSLLQKHREVFEEFGIDCERELRASGPGSPPLGLLGIAGPLSWPLGEVCCGTHVDCLADDRLVPIQIILLPRIDGESLRDVAARFERQRAEWINDLAAGKSFLPDDPFPLGPVLRITATTPGREATVDWRTGLTLASTMSAADLRALILAALPASWGEG